MAAAPQTPAEFAAAFGMTTPASAPVNPPAQYFQHRTVAGERWDSLAWRYYGDPTLVNPIIMANPSVPIEPVFEGGISIAIPILAQEFAPLDLPPWGTL